MDFAAQWKGRLLRSEGSVEVQLVEALLIACILGLIFPSTARSCSKYFKSRPWYPRTAALMKEMQEKMMNIEIPDAMIEKGMGDMVNIFSQHLLGGFLCAPAVFGLGVRREVAVALARHGALIELGWEIEDTVVRLHERFFTQDGCTTQPNAIFFFMFMHHAMQWAFVIPMNLYYSDLSGYHELVFMLEGAAGFAGAVGFYGWTLDTGNRSDLRQMIALCSFNLVVMVYTRFVHYWWSLYKVLSHFYLEGSYVLLLVGVVCGCFMMPYIGASFIPEAYRKLCKFIQLYADGGDTATKSKDDAVELPSLLESPVAKVHADFIHKGYKEHVE